MLTVVIEDFSEYNGRLSTDSKKVYALWRKNLKKAATREDIKLNTVGITMPSTNEETYIFKKDGLVYIQTCNNHTWDFEVPDLAYYEGVDEESDAKRLDNVIRTSFFYDIRTGLIHTTNRYDEREKNTTCPNCHRVPYGYYVDMEGKKICASCHEGYLGITEEKQLSDLKSKQSKTITALTHLEL